MEKENKMDRQQYILKITKRLLIFAGVSVVITSITFLPNLLDQGHRVYISWLTFECGIIGGFVSIQQRLKKIEDQELSLLAKSWASILLVPIYGGIFALLLYILFLSGLIEGAMFPEFDLPTFSSPVTDADISSLLKNTYPKTPADFAKLLFWSFLAGFSERFVPQIIQNVQSSYTKPGSNK